MALFPAFLADDGAVRASAAADTNHVDTVVANSAVDTEVFFTCTVTADTAFSTQLIVRTFTAFFVTFGTDSLYTLRTPSTADTDKFRAHLAGFAVIAKVSVTACTILTDVASAADFFLGAVGTFFAAFGADGGTVCTSVSTDADLHAVFADPALGAVIALAADAVKADPAVAAQLIVGAALTFFPALGTDLCTVRASAAAYADLIHTVIAQTAFRTEIALTADTIDTGTALGAQLIVGARLAFLCTFGTDYGTL